MILDFSRLADVLLNNRFWLAPLDCVLCAAVTFNNYTSAPFVTTPIKKI